jgi:hypothetical protein
VTIALAPTLSSISPTSAVAGTTFTMTLKGTNFVSGAQVVVAGAPAIAATFNSATQLTATIPGSAIPLLGSYNVTVVNPGGLTSAAKTLSVSNPSPRITTLSPSVVALESPTFTLTITGTGFVPTSVARWSGASIPTTYVSPTQLQATVASSLFPKTGNYTVTVQNPSPGGGGSNGVNVTVN